MRVGGEREGHCMYNDIRVCLYNELVFHLYIDSVNGFIDN